MTCNDKQPLLENSRQSQESTKKIGLGGGSKCREAFIILIILFINMLGLCVDMLPVTFFAYVAGKRRLAEYQTGIILGCYDFGRLVSGPFCVNVVNYDELQAGSHVFLGLYYILLFIF